MHHLVLLFVGAFCVLFGAFAAGGSGGAFESTAANAGSRPPNDAGFPQDESEATGRHGTPVDNQAAHFDDRDEFTPPDCAHGLDPNEGPDDKRCVSLAALCMTL